MMLMPMLVLMPLFTPWLMLMLMLMLMLVLVLMLVLMLMLMLMPSSDTVCR